jgi:hypothetical protein
VPPNPQIAAIDAHLDNEGKIIGPLPQAARSQAAALITKAFNQLRAALALVTQRVSGVPSRVTAQLASDLRAVLSQEGQDKECFRTRSTSLCKPVLAKAHRQFSQILADRRELDGYNP